MFKKIVILCFILVLLLILFNKINNNSMYSRDIFAMDTTMNLTAYGKNCEKAVDEAVSKIYELDKIFSSNDSESEISKLNLYKSINASYDTFSIIKKSLEISQKTNGAFDITVYPIVKEWGFISKEFNVPSQLVIDELVKHVGYSNVKLRNEKKLIELKDKNAEIDLGAIAKGYTASEIINIFNSYNIKSAIISLGGNVQTLGKKKGSLWKVAIQNPDDESSYIGIVNVSDMSVVTSGGYQRYFEKDNKIYHHIIDPKTGYPSQSGLKSVTIISKDGTLADGLSTALFIMGKEKATNFWKDNSDLFDVVFITDNNEIFITEGIKDNYTAFDTKYFIIEK